MAQPVELTIGMILRLKRVCDDILFERDANGLVKERNLPFRLKYRLGKNMTHIDKYSSSFMQNQLYFKATFGTENPETHKVELDEEGKKKQINILQQEKKLNKSSQNILIQKLFQHIF